MHIKILTASSLKQIYYIFLNRGGSRFITMQELDTGYVSFTVTETIGV